MEIYTGDQIDVEKDRHLYIGGSDIPSLMGKGSFGDVYDLTLGKFGKELGLEMPNNSHFMGKYIEYGNVMEPKIRRWWNSEHDSNFEETCVIEKDKGFRANVDGYDFEKNALIEIKTYGDTLRMEEYIMQCQFYMHVFKVKEVTLLTYKREKDTKNPLEPFKLTFNADLLTVHVIKYDEVFIQQMLSSIHKYSSVAQAFVNNPDIERQELLDMMVDETILNELKAQSNELFALEFVIDELKEAEKEAKEMKAAMLSKMEEHGVYALETNNYKFSYVEASKSVSFDAAKFKKENPELAEQYQKETTRKGYVRVSKKKGV